MADVIQVQKNNKDDEMVMGIGMKLLEQYMGGKSDKKPKEEEKDGPVDRRMAMQTPK